MSYDYNANPQGHVQEFSLEIHWQPILATLISIIQPNQNYDH